MKTVLFVVDEPNALDDLRELTRARSLEWSTLFASSVDEGVKYLHEVTVDAIVTDISTPGRSVIDLLKHIRLNPVTDETPCLLITDPGATDLRQPAREAGVTDFLNKPVDFDELCVRVDNAIRVKRYQDEAMEQGHVLNYRIMETRKQLEYSRRLVLLRLALAAEWRDQDTGEHIVRVGLLSSLIAHQLGFDDDTQARILVTGPLHDVGKIGLSDRILTGTGKLTADERKEMETHCEVGYKILTGDARPISPLLTTDSGMDLQSDLLDQAAVIALTHHEKWDGTGYPRGLKCEEIPIEGRIVAVADVYDALRSRRPYKDKMSKSKAAQIIREGSGSHFDPIVAEALLARLDDAEAILAHHSDVRPHLHVA